LKGQKDVLELGRHLVDELGFQNGANTLGRWMAHHLAELIDKAENGSTPRERSSARKDAIRTILKVWEYRKSLPGNADPLKSYENVLIVLDRLRPGSSQFFFSDYAQGGKRNQLAVELFDSFSKLTLALLFMRMPVQKTTSPAKAPVKKALNKQERQVLAAIEMWAGIFAPVAEGGGLHSESKGASSHEHIELPNLALQLIAKIGRTLEELQKELQAVP
jgi:hypothetical protein